MASPLTLESEPEGRERRLGLADLPPHPSAKVGAKVHFLTGWKDAFPPPALMMYYFYLLSECFGFPSLLLGPVLLLGCS